MDKDLNNLFGFFENAKPEKGNTAQKNQVAFQKENHQARYKHHTLHNTRYQ
jgi:hypothetical protein